MQHTPLISVIIPTYNRADLLPRAVRSACGQTYRNLEILIVDDASADNTEEVARVLEKEDARVRYVKRKENGGANAARNTGTQESKGEYIALLDSDDEWLPEKIEKQIEVFEKSLDKRLGLVYCGYETICVENGKKYPEKIHTPKKRALKKLLIQNIIGTSSVLIKKSFLQKSGEFDEHEQLVIGEDHDMWIRLAEHCTFACLPNVCLLYYVHAKSTTSTTQTKVFTQSQDYLFQKHRTLYEKYPSAYTQALVRYALRLVLYKQPRRAMHTMVQAFKMRPCIAFFAVPAHAFSFASKIIRKKIHGC